MSTLAPGFHYKSHLSSALGIVSTLFVFWIIVGSATGLYAFALPQRSEPPPPLAEPPIAATADAIPGSGRPWLVGTAVFVGSILLTIILSGGGTPIAAIVMSFVATAIAVRSEMRR